MASLSLQSLLVASAYLIGSTAAIDTQLVGTWSTKSAKVITGPVCTILKSGDGDRKSVASPCKDQEG